MNPFGWHRTAALSAAIRARARDGLDDLALDGMERFYVRGLWQRIERRLAILAPEILENLGPPAADADLELLESQFAAPLPGELTESYRVHDGQPDSVESLFGRFRLLPVAHVIRIRRLLAVKECPRDESEAEPASQRVRNVAWSAGWIPVAADGLGELYCVDLDPTSRGERGQVIRVRPNQGVRWWIARSMREWLDDFAARLEDGRLIARTDWGLVDAAGEEGNFCSDLGLVE